MSNLLKRIESLEQRLSSLEAPQPVKVFFEEQQAEQDEFRRLNPGGKTIIIVTVCARHCPDVPGECVDRARKSCRYSQPGTQEHREVNRE